MRRSRIVSPALLIVITIVTAVGQTRPNPEDPRLNESRELTTKVVRLFAEGKYDEALPLAQRALTLREAAVGAEDIDLVPLLINLGELYKAKHKPSDARPFFARALKIAEEKLGTDNLQVAAIIDRLAYVAYALREDTRAAELFERSLEIREKILGPEHPDLTQTAFALAEIDRLHGDYAQAESLYQQIIRIREKVGKPGDAELIKALESYVALLSSQHKVDQALEIQKQLSELVGKNGTLQGGVLNGKAIKLVQPVYPVAARSDHASGTVEVRVLIDEAGNVISAKAINPGSTHLALINAAEDAARHSLFTPTLLSGVAVKVNGIIIYNFVAQ